MVVLISGNLSEVKGKLTQLYLTVKYRKNNGWPLWQPDENWEYTTEQDDNVCPICEAFGADFNIIGEMIPELFPDRTRLEPTLFRPEVHLSQNLYPDLKGECRCLMGWPDYLEILVQRLITEMKESVGEEAITF